MKMELTSRNFHLKMNEIERRKVNHISLHLKNFLREIRPSDTSRIYSNSSFVAFVRERDKLGRLIQDKPDNSNTPIPAKSFYSIKSISRQSANSKLKTSRTLQFNRTDEVSKKHIKSGVVYLKINKVNFI